MGEIGVDVGTNRLVSATVVDENVVFKTERDAFYRVITKSAVNKEAIKASLDKAEANYITEGDNFIVVGEHAIRMALDRNDSSMRPMQKGVISPKDKANLPILKLLLKELVGNGNGDKLIFSIPAEPVDGDFDIEYHKTLLEMFFNELGYVADSINEAFAVGLNELLDEEVTGIAISSGAGLQNVAIMAQGDPIVTFSTMKSGDFIDKAVAQNLDLSPSLVQLEKESGINLYSEQPSKIKEAIVVYYKSVVKYTVNHISNELKKRKGNIPVFREKIPVVLSGGLAWAKGYDKLFYNEMKKVELPFEISDVRIAANPDNSVASGCLLISKL